MSVTFYRILLFSAVILLIFTGFKLQKQEREIFPEDKFAYLRGVYE